jgi:hypothetical protein
VAAMARPDWRSEDSVEIYCRCRTLPLVLSRLPKYQKLVGEHLKKILTQLEEHPSRLAIGEASGDSQEDWYPPNAFHTYWTLEILSTLESRFPSDFDSLRDSWDSSRFDLKRVKAEMLLWAHQTAGRHIALHAAESSKLDSDQLAWSLTILGTFGEDFNSNLSQQDFIRCGFKTLFEHQTEIGLWRTGAPLFHYKKSGNAYCYVFETFTALLKSTLAERKESRFLREALRPYLPRLLRLWNYAKATQIPLKNKIEMGWNSGHRPNGDLPESWATACVYSFSQCLRRLIGIWTREFAAAQLGAIPPWKTSDEAIKTLWERGETWGVPSKTAANQLTVLFVNPVRFFRNGTDARALSDGCEPDSEPIGEDQARAAILFGPPGTSKTTLAESMASAVGWNYVELHASHFVADGLPNVQRKADTIFEMLLQLDRTVILFDEIDELVRERDKEADAFGRFLTTSMLPKLAELWKRRKVLYFIATNHIEFFDRAITRAQRFDALIHVPPPSFQRKLNKLKEILGGPFQKILDDGLTAETVQKVLSTIAPDDNSGGQTEKSKPLQKSLDEQAEERLPVECMLAKFLLMRWDQLHELAARIRKASTGTEIVLNRRILETALGQLSDQTLTKKKPYLEYLAGQVFEMHDFGKVSVWEIQGSVPAQHRQTFEEKSGKLWRVSKTDFDDFSDLGCQCRHAAPGILRHVEVSKRMKVHKTRGRKR